MLLMDVIGPIVNRVLRKLGIREEINTETIIDATNTDIPFLVDSELGFGQYADSNLTGKEWENIASGDTINVVLDGVKYTCSAVRDETDIYIGNRDGTPDGLPFLFMLHYTGTNWDMEINVMSTAPTHRFALYKQTETITPISDKYLPGVCLPVVELSSIDMNNWEEDSKQLSAEEAVALDKVLASGAKYLMVHSYSYEIPFVFTLPAIYDDDGAVYAYMGYVYGVGALAIANEEGAWVIAREV